jgi:hypothetical protein
MSIILDLFQYFQFLIKLSLPRLLFAKPEQLPVKTGSTASAAGSGK